jgi:hypothetical protein
MYQHFGSACLPACLPACVFKVVEEENIVVHMSSQKTGIFIFTAVRNQTSHISPSEKAQEVR